MKPTVNIHLVKSFMITTDNSGITPPMGIMHVAGALRRRGNYSIKISDSRLLGGAVNNVMPRLREQRPDIVGISAITMEAPFMHRLAARIKAEFPRTLIVAGGPHPTMYPEDTLLDTNIDFAVIGEGEETFCELVEAISAGEERDIRNVRGIARRENGGVVQNEPRPFIEDLDSLPFPAWDLIDRAGYARRNSMANLGKRPYMGLFTSRACPYNCVYCHRIFGKGFRPHSPGYVLDMMETLNGDFGISEYEIYDDIFNWDARRMAEICRGIGGRNLDLRLIFPNGLRGDILTEPQVQSLVDAGTIYVCLAVETASPRLQREIRKNLKLDRLREVMDHFAARRVYQVGFFMLGFPGETLDEMQLTVNFALHSPLHGAYFFIVTPFRGTELFDMAGDEAIRRARSGFEDHDYFKGNYNMSAVPDDLFFSLQRRAFGKFYLRPQRMWRILRDHPNRRCLMDYFLITLRKAILKERGNKMEELPSCAQ